MKPLPDAPVDATLVLRRNQESLWLSNKVGTFGKRYYIVLDSQGRPDYPILYTTGTAAYDFPERLSKPFKKMVAMHMVANQQ